MSFANAWILRCEGPFGRSQNWVVTENLPKPEVWRDPRILPGLAALAGIRRMTLPRALNFMHHQVCSVPNRPTASILGRALRSCVADMTAVINRSVRRQS